MDLAVLEVGMGGRLDATNVVSPLVSVVSNISLDHTEYLGRRLEEIAWEKGGIIKEWRGLYNCGEAAALAKASGRNMPHERCNAIQLWEGK